MPCHPSNRPVSANSRARRTARSFCELTIVNTPPLATTTTRLRLATGLNGPGGRASVREVSGAVPAGRSHPRDALRVAAQVAWPHPVWRIHAAPGVVVGRLGAALAGGGDQKRRCDHASEDRRSHNCIQSARGAHNRLQSISSMNSLTGSPHQPWPTVFPGWLGRAPWRS
jgi:hypothetical protein